MNAVDLAVFSSRMVAICEEMGAMLCRAAFSPNIKDRLDFSCAVFDSDGGLCAQAAHIPVHLGSMAYAMAEIVDSVDWAEGDMVVVNDPYLGGTHLPDVTVIAPVYFDRNLAGFVANRAHHADIGCESPGSMPIARCLQEEGLVIPPTRLVRAGILDEAYLDSLFSADLGGGESRGDFIAQVGSNRIGCERLQALIAVYGLDGYVAGLDALNNYAERLASTALQRIPDGEYRYTDVMDDDGCGNNDIPITVCIRVSGGRVTLDFTGTAPQVEGNINCPMPVLAAGVFYAFRCLMPVQTPSCAGAMRLIELIVPKGCLVNAQSPAAVAAGNVETSTRIVDVVFGALADALPEDIPAASHGSMNNLAMGARSEQGSWSYYETIGGGMGASAVGAGLDAVQTHMTNTLNTPIESLEMTYPLQVVQYAVRRGSGGGGLHCGGDGTVREYRFLEPAEFTILSERRMHSPWGLAGGEDGQTGQNFLDDECLPGKVNRKVAAGQCLRIETPGAGGWGREKK